MNSVLNYNYVKLSLDNIFLFTALICQGLEAPGSDPIECGEIMQTIIIIINALLNTQQGVAL